MQRYDPAMAPDPAVWLALEEDERMELIEVYHRRARIRLPNLALHAAVHTMVENQIAMGDELPVQRTVERLVREGLDRHEALHAVGEEAMAYMSELMQAAGGAVSGNDETAEAAALARYNDAVEALTASRWLDSADDGGEEWPRTIEDVINDLLVSQDMLPEASMQWALDNWDQAAPRLLRILHDYISGADRTPATACALLFAIHLFAEKREARAFAAVCALLEDPILSDEVLGDAVTDTLTRILIAIFDGDRLALRRVIEASDADPFVRYAALEAMAYLTRTGRIPEDETRTYLGHLFQVMEPRGDDPVWDAWATCVANLGYADLESEVESLLQLGYIGPMMQDIDWFRDRLRLVLDDPEGLAGFAEDEVGPFGGAIEELTSWGAFSDVGDEIYDDEIGDDDFGEEVPRWSAEVQPIVNTMRHVGRNDPCPCGSGRKYKKCCLQ